jgi:hypothetical protein
MKPTNIDDLLKDVADDLQQYLDDVADAFESPPTEEEIRRVEADRERQFEEMKKSKNNK